MAQNPSYARSPAELAAELAVDPTLGLSPEVAALRLSEVGPNELLERRGKGKLRIFLQQLTSTLVLLLIAAGFVSYFLGDLADAIAILVIVLLNAVLGFRQEYRAEQAVAALKRLSIPATRVLRGGETLTVPARELVPGDLVLLEAGDLVPADLRLLEGHALAAQEAALTGESAPVAKEALDSLPSATPLAERRNQLFRGTVVVHGRGTALVCATGMSTELGRVASLLQEVERDATPLQKRLDHLGRILALAALLLVAVVVLLGFARGEDWRILMLTAVSLAVAAVPEGLPAVVTIALALGAQRMLARNALIRRLPAVETLGSVTAICSDKTGTLTRNQMAVSAIETAGESSSAAQPTPAARLLLACAVLCSDARNTEKGLVGDPTEVALLEAALLAGVDPQTLNLAWPRREEIPFDSARRRMATLVENVDQAANLGGALGADLLPGPFVVCVKGAFEDVLADVGDVLGQGGRAPLSAEVAAEWLSLHDRLAADGQRVLAVAARSFAARPSSEEMEEGLLLLGLVAAIDPARDTVAEAMTACHRAGIRPMMITGDHPLTAGAIARQIGLEGDSRPGGNGPVLTGHDLDALADGELGQAIHDVSIYARVEPEHKLRLIDALRQQGHVVAMTGDGVNDAPALKRADIGVAMGKVGTDVAKEAADMVLLDDDFATILAAVEEGRRIYDNLRKFLRYLLASNVSELAVMLAGPFCGLPLPLLPLQILWMNLITDGLPALALGFEPAEPHAMKRPPYPPGESLLARGLLRDVLWIGLSNGFVALLVGAFYARQGSPLWQTMIFTVLVISQIGLAVALRSERHGWWSLGLLSNKTLLFAGVSALALQAAITYLPPLARIFRLVPLGPGDLILALGASMAVPLLVELQKLWRRRQSA